MKIIFYLLFTFFSLIVYSQTPIKSEDSDLKTYFIQFENNKPINICKETEESFSDFIQNNYVSTIKCDIYSNNKEDLIKQKKYILNFMKKHNVKKLLIDCYIDKINAGNTYIFEL